jgi:hypothetical protein
MTMHKIHALVEFWAEVPDDDLEADDHADRVSDSIFLAVDGIEGIENVSVIDWTQKEGPSID